MFNKLRSLMKKKVRHKDINLISKEAIEMGKKVRELQLKKQNDKDES